MPRRSKRLSKKARRKNRRASIANALGLTPGTPKGANLREAKALDTAAAAARHVNHQLSTGGDERQRRESLELLKKTKNLFGSSGDSGEDDPKLAGAFFLG